LAPQLTSCCGVFFLKILPQRDILPVPARCRHETVAEEDATTMETVKTASFEYLIDLAKENPEGGYTFVLDGTSYQIQDVLEISGIATRHGYIVIY